MERKPNMSYLSLGLKLKGLLIGTAFLVFFKKLLGLGMHEINVEIIHTA